KAHTEPQHREQQPLADVARVHDRPPLCERARTRRAPPCWRKIRTYYLALLVPSILPDSSSLAQSFRLRMGVVLPVLSLALIAFRAECCRIAIRSAPVCFTDNLAN